MAHNLDSPTRDHAAAQSRRIQAAIDQCFYRQKYDAEKTAASFANTTRSEVDQPTLADRWVQVVVETVQPESINLWLRKEDLN